MFKLIIASLVLGLVISEPIRLPLPGRLRNRPGHYPSYANVVKDSTHFIVGGTTAQKGQNPHQCSLRRSSHSCGASIISDQWVVTAAHCIDGASASSLTLRCGTLTHASGGQDYKVAEVVAHPSYSSYTLDNDIGLLRINGQFTLGSSDMDKIALPAQGEAIPAGTVVTVTGWGATSEGGGLPSALQTLDVPVVANDVCNQKYSGFNDITDQMFCAGIDAGGKDSCQGDSGGPVKSNGKLVGAVSWGYGCARPNYPGVYTRVASFRNWITEKTGV